MAAPALQRPVVRKTAVEPARQVVSVLEGLYRQFAFYGRILAGLPRGLRYRNEILAVMGDIVFGPGALIVGAGMIFVVPKAKVDAARRVLKRAGETPWMIGDIRRQRRGGPRVEYV